jgi:hypothetical protein
MPDLHEIELALFPGQRAHQAADAVTRIAKDAAHAPLVQTLPDEIGDGSSHRPVLELRFRCCTCLPTQHTAAA